MTKPTREQLNNLYLAQNLTAKQIAVRFGCSVTTVRKWLNGFGLAKTDGAGYAVRYARFVK